MAGKDAITMLKDDHKAVEHLFRRFETAGDRAYVEQREVVDRIIEELSVHAAVEEQLFYPVVRATVPGTEDTTLESLEEHHIVKWLLSELEGLSPQDERFDAKVTVLIENVRHHVAEEEGELFPMVRSELGRNALSDLGDAMAAAKKVAPTHPHPRAADTPPMNMAAGTAAGVADRIGDTVSGLAQGGVTAVGDIIASVLGRKKPRVSPTGSQLTRSTAASVRSRASEATEAAIEAARAAKRTGTNSAKRTARHTARTARTTGSSARAGATSTVRAAKGGATSTARAARAGVKGTATSTRTSTRRAVATARRGATTTGRTARTAAKRTAATAKRSASRTASTAKRSAPAR